MAVAVCMIFLTALCLAGSAGNVRGEEGKTAVEKKAGETSTEGKFSEEKEEFKRKAKARLDELNKKIDALEAKSEELGSWAKTEIKEDMKSLRAKRAALRKDKATTPVFAPTGGKCAFPPFPQRPLLSTPDW